MDLFTLSVRVLNLFFELRNIHPIVVNYILDKLFFPLVLPEQGRVRPLVFGTVLGDLVADLIQIIYNLGRVLLDIRVVANLEIEKALDRLDFFFLNIFTVGVLFLLHARQHLFSSFLVDLVHFVLHFRETTNHIVD